MLALSVDSPVRLSQKGLLNAAAHHFSSNGRILRRAQLALQLFHLQSHAQPHKHAGRST